MKKSLLLVLAFISLPSFAFINEVECEWQQNEKWITADVERPFPSNATFKRLLVGVQQGDISDTFSYTVTTRRLNGFNEIQYFSGAVRLVVDIWPDNVPRWGRVYRGTLQTPDIQNQAITGLDCRFPNAQ